MIDNVYGYFSPLPQKHATGVGQHAIRMLACLARLLGERFSLLTTEDEYSEALNDLCPDLVNARRKLLPGSAKWVRRSSVDFPLITRHVGETQNSDWVYCPKEQPLMVKGARLATTIHDIRMLEKVDDLPNRSGIVRRWRRLQELKRLVKRSALIFSVSNYTKSQVVRVLGADPGRIVVVGNGVSECFFSRPSDDSVDLELLDRYGLVPGRYLLAVGSLTRRKGGDLLLSVARNGLAEVDRELCIAVAGRRHDADLLAEFERTSTAFKGRLKLLNYVDEVDLAVLYRRSLGLIFPSRYEGFGIPIIEGLASGTRVVAANNSAIPEVLNGYGSLIPSGDTLGLLQAVDDLVKEGENDRAGWVTRGVAYASQFSWERCAQRAINAMAEF